MNTHLLVGVDCFVFFSLQYEVAWLVMHNMDVFHPLSVSDHYLLLRADTDKIIIFTFLKKSPQTLV